MNHTASGLPRPDRTERRVARDILPIEIHCFKNRVTPKKCKNGVGEHEPIDYIDW